MLKHNQTTVASGWILHLVFCSEQGGKRVTAAVQHSRKALLRWTPQLVAWERCSFLVRLGRGWLVKGTKLLRTNADLPC